MPGLGLSSAGRGGGAPKISLSTSLVGAGLAAGTVLAAIKVNLPGAFTYVLDPAYDANDGAAVSGSNLVATSTPLVAGSYSLRITATRAADGLVITQTLAAPLVVATATGAPVNTSAPVLSVVGGGAAKIGSKVSVTSGIWTNSPAFYTYQADLDGVTLFYGVSSQMTLDMPLFGGNVRYTVRAYNVFGVTAAVSNTLGPVSAGPQSGFFGASNSAAMAVASTSYWWCWGARDQINSNNTTQGKQTYKHRGASIVLVGITADVLANTWASTVKAVEVFKGGVSTGMILNVGATKIGQQFSQGAPVQIDDGDTIELNSVTPSGSGSISIPAYFFHYEMLDPSQQVISYIVGNQSMSRTAGSPNTSYYGMLGPAQAANNSANSGNYVNAVGGNPFPAPHTLSQWEVYLFSVSGTGTATWTLTEGPIGGPYTDTSLTFSYDQTTSVNAWKGDYSHSVNIAADHQAMWRCDMTGTLVHDTEVMKINAVGAVANQTLIYMTSSGGGSAVTPGQTKWSFPFGGSVIVETAAEANSQGTMPGDATFSKMRTNVSVSTSTTSAGLGKLRINGADGTLSVSNTLATATVFKDDTHSDFVKAGSKVNVADIGPGGGSNTINMHGLLVTRPTTPLYVRGLASGQWLVGCSHTIRWNEAYGGPLANATDGTTTADYSAAANGRPDWAAVKATFAAWSSTNPLRILKRYNQGTLGSTGDETVTNCVLDYDAGEPDGLWPMFRAGYSGPTGGYNNGYGSIGSGFTFDPGNCSFVAVIAPNSNVATSGGGGANLEQVTLVSFGAATDANRVDICSGDNDFTQHFGLGMRKGASTPATKVWPTNANALPLAIDRNLVIFSCSTTTAVDGVAAPNATFEVNGVSKTVANTGATSVTGGTCNSARFGRDFAGNACAFKDYGVFLPSTSLINAQGDDRARIRASFAPMFGINLTVPFQVVGGGSSTFSDYSQYGTGVPRGIAKSLGAQYRFINLARAGTDPSVISTNIAAMGGLIDQVNYKRNIFVHLTTSNALQAGTPATTIRDELFAVADWIGVNKSGTLVVFAMQPFNGTTAQNAERDALAGYMLDATNKAAHYNYEVANLPAISQLSDPTNLAYFDASGHPNKAGAPYYVNAIVPLITARGF